MAGVIPGFDPDEFRSAIRFAMDMGAPEALDKRATFYFPKTKTATGPTDASGVPFGPDATVTSAPSKDPVRVSCSITDAAGEAQVTDIGNYGDAIVVTLLDQDFQQVVGFEYVVYKGNRYDYLRELLGGGLGSVGIHQLLCTGEGRL